MLFFMRLILFTYAATWMGISALADNTAFFYALDADYQALKESAREAGQPIQVGSRSIHRLHLGPHTIYAVKMGSGAVETAASAQAVLTRFHCDWAFALGPAGALTDKCPIGSWYRVARIVAWQRGVAGIAGTVQSEASSWNYDWSKMPVTNLPAVLQTTSGISVASGEMFVTSSSERERLYATTETDVVDMNSFGLALVCADHNVPLFAWKIISDNADENASENFRAFVAKYRGEGGKALADVIGALPSNPHDPSTYPAIKKLLRDK